MRVLSRLAIGVSSVALTASTGLVANAQTTPTTTQAPVLEEIIVTVERREQSIQRVAATVQNFSAEDLQRLGVNSDFSNLQYATPGLQIADQEGKVQVYLRGIGSSDTDFSSDPSVATHFNGVYVARPRGIGPLFFDAERVEVNKGPQGTLRGRNATGGTINILSRRPDTTDFGGHVQAGIGNFDARELEAAVNVPLMDTLAVRAAVWARKHDGLYENAFLEGNDRAGFKTPSSADDMAFRVSGLWRPTDRTSVYLMYQKSEGNSSGDPGTFSGRALSAGYDIKDLDDPWKQYFRTEGNFNQNLDTLLGVINYDFDSFGVEYSGAYNTVDAYNQNASREWQLGMVYPGSEREANYIRSGANPQRNLLVNDTFYQSDQSKSQVHELRFYSLHDGPLSWTAGAFYFKEKFDYLSWDVGNGFCGESDFFNAPAPLGPNTISCWQNGLGGENRGDDSEVESLAFYADATYEVTDRLRLKGGLRYSDERKTQNDFNAQYQFTFNRQFFLSRPGISRPSDLIIGERGFRLKKTDDVNLPFAIPAAGVDALNLFQNSIQSYGMGDNWGQLLQACATSPTLCEVSVSSVFDNPNTPTVELRQTNEVKGDFLDWRAGIEYDIGDRSMAYFTVSTGTRSAGINRPIVLNDGRPLARTWNPEKLTAYELGSKNRFEAGDIPVTLNAAAFYYDYKDRVAQVLVDVPNPTPQNPNATTQQVQTDNVADAEVYGLEIEGQAALPAGFNLGATLLWMDSNFKNSSILDPRSNDNLVVNIDGNRLPNTSTWNANFRLSQTIEINRGWLNSFDWTINVLYRSKYYLTPFNNKGYIRNAQGQIVEVPIAQMPAPNNNGALAFEPYPDGQGVPANGLFLRDRVPGFFMVNANFGVNFGEDDRFRVDAYAENLTNTAFSTFGFVNSSVNIRYLNAPRMYGVRFRATY